MFGKLRLGSVPRLRLSVRFTASEVSGLIVCNIWVSYIEFSDCHFGVPVFETCAVWIWRTLRVSVRSLACLKCRA